MDIQRYLELYKKSEEHPEESTPEEIEEQVDLWYALTGLERPSLDEFDVEIGSTPLEEKK